MRRKLLIYLATVLLLALAGLALWIGLSSLSRGLGLEPSRWALATIALALGIGFQPVRRRVATSVDRRLYPRKLALRGLENQLIPDLAGGANVDEVAAKLVQVLRSRLSLASVALFVSDSAGRFYRLSALDPSALDAAEGALGVEELAAWHGPWKEEPYVVVGGDDTSRVPEILRRLDTRYALPLLFNDELLGLLALGRPGDGPDLDASDLDRLAHLAHPVSAMLENARLFALASHDTVTGLSRRRIFQERLMQELARSRRTLRPLAIAIADVDDFKQLNDRWGHQAGDQVLRSLSRTLKTNCRASDVVSRIGGEEFGLLFPETAADAAVAQADRLRSAVHTDNIPIDDEKVATPTISIGVCAWTPPGIDTEAGDLLRSADEALYRAKRAGKNRVELARAGTAAMPAGSSSPQT